MISAGVVPRASSHRRKSFTRTRCVAGAFSWTATVIEVSPSPISPTQEFDCSADRPRATASYSDSAVTSMEWCTPLGSSQDTRQISRSHLARIPCSCFVRPSGYCESSQYLSHICLFPGRRQAIRSCSSGSVFKIVQQLYFGSRRDWCATRRQRPFSFTHT